MQRVLAWTIAFLCLVGAGCGGDDDDDATNATSATTAASADTDASVTTKAGDGGTTVDVCGLLTAEEVSGFVGKTVVVEPQAATSGGGACEWVDPAVGGYVARVTVGRASVYETLKSRQATDLAGLGDEAWTTHTAGATGDYDIGVKVGERHVLVFFTEGLDIEKAKAMTQRILDELP